MKTYFQGEDGFYVKRHLEWVYIGHQLDPADSSEEIILTDNVAELIEALQQIKHDVALEKAQAAEREKVAAWNQGGGIPDKQEYNLALPPQ